LAADIQMASRFLLASSLTVLMASASLGQVATKRSATKAVPPDSGAVATNGTTTGTAATNAPTKATCAKGLISIPQAFVSAVQALSAQQGAAAAVATGVAGGVASKVAAKAAGTSSGATCVSVADAQAYMETAALALTSRGNGSASGATGMMGLASSAGGAAGAAEMTSAGQSRDAVKAGLATALSATPQGMLVNGAIAAAPAAGSAMKALSGRFSRGESKESMTRDLTGGRLVVKGIRFADGSDALADGASQTIDLLGEALQGVDGHFVMRLPAESDGKNPPDTSLARQRLERVAAHLSLAGITEPRLAIAGPESSSKGKPAKPGEARIEIVRADGKP
jgi:hypothetical protein